ncbi:DsbA family oxidoreductase [Kineosporia sp. NBRC 101731]|uniref:DsbA family oxidoreductase n=1 Tax=Kineosporia sp. NBRC 101731 TaxID=3032199 RepID=UPI00249F9B1A|nr:DsbA family oxidoreductase [Kineosporia sp. NBRC 101731]GLY29884.1 DSBA oxidoreductase [Kineosporia sp. NBRC 101731]
MAGAFGPAAEPITIDVWSDVVCPFCYLGDAHLQQAIEAFPHASSVQVRYHSFQLHPGAVETRPVTEYLIKDRGMSPDQLAASHQHLTAQGAEAGLDYRFADSLVFNTKDAHRLIHFAKAEGRDHEMVLRLFRAEFTEGLDLADHGVLADLAVELGFSREAVIAALSSDAYEADFEADVAAAQQMGINGVPFFVFDGKRAISGAQPVEMFRRALDLSWQDRAAQPA